MTGLPALALPAFISPTLLGAIGIAVVTGGSGFWLEHTIASAKYSRLETSYALSEKKAVELARADEQRRAKLTYAADLEAAKAGQKIINHTEEVVKRIPVYVTAHADSTCHLTVGFLRAVNSAFFGTDIPGTPAVPNDTDAGISLSEATGILATNGGRCRLSKDQGNKWRGWAEGQLAAVPK
jgi:hypothetical protein